jgi:hypothetical protein
MCCIRLGADGCYFRGSDASDGCEGTTWREAIEHRGRNGIYNYSVYVLSVGKRMLRAGLAILRVGVIGGCRLTYMHLTDMRQVNLTGDDPP